MADEVTPIVEPGKIALGKFGQWAPDQVRTTGVKVLVYGTSGSGKTYFASTFPDPVFIDLEGGLGTTKTKPLRIPKDPKRVVDNFPELVETGTMLSESLKGGKAPFKTVVIDSLSEMVEIVLRNILSEFDANRQYEDQPTQADYGKLNRDFMKLFRAFLRLPCNIVFTNVIAPRKYEEEQIAPSFVGNRIGPEVCRLVDAIGFTYTTRSGKGDAEEIRYLVNFANTPDHVGKDRLGIGNKSKSNSFDAVFK